MNTKEKRYKKTLNRIRKEFEGLSSVILDTAKTGQLPADFKQRMGTQIESQIAYFERKATRGAE